MFGNCVGGQVSPGDIIPEGILRISPSDGRLEESKVIGVLYSMESSVCWDLQSVTRAHGIPGCSFEKDCRVSGMRLPPFIVGAEVGTKREMLRHSNVDYLEYIRLHEQKH